MLEAGGDQPGKEGREDADEYEDNIEEECWSMQWLCLVSKAATLMCREWRMTHAPAGQSASAPNSKGRKENGKFAIHS